MSNVILQSAARAAPLIARTAGRIALAYANSAISRAFDNRVFEGPRLEQFHLLTSQDGAPMARVFGRVRLAGQVIWAARITEIQTDEQVGGKGGGPVQRDYSYSISFAIGLCEGEISGIGRIWANGEILRASNLNYRVHYGADGQVPDPLIAEIEGGDVPAFRGVAYIVFEDFPLDDYGARLPQINVEVFAAPDSVGGEPRLEDLVTGVNLIPGSGEFVYATTPVEELIKPGQTRALNVNNMDGRSDASIALDQLQSQLPNCKHVSLIVSWFGDDLRAGQCKLRPGIERRDRVTQPLTWRVNGQTRDTAILIREAGGNAVYGGTPDDSSVIDMIRELKSRGFSVTLYPFILMDVDSKTGQGAFPWRGRIISVAADDSAAAQGEVAAFFGACSASDFAADGETVTYNGPVEDSFRRMILHYAKLAGLAGGVDKFIIGSEMRGLTTIRGGGLSYPAVSAFKTLAADVRSVMGAQTQLTYAADWSEYFGHHFGDNVIFHLDPLWADPNIDAVGIDAYFSLSDWREEADHLDGALTDNIYDTDYLAGNIEGGEGYEWFYASAADRESQNRTAITDGAYSKPWVYRYKDLKNWWTNPHYNRIDGVEQAMPTSWTPQSKPIWLTEIGCPAIDKGANQPNVFYDPKSSESAAPYHSTAQRDDLIQRRYLESLLTYYSEGGANNPVSSVYGGPMIAPDHRHVWCWDARPFPDFPVRDSVWADGENWSRGHWLSGRVGAAMLGDVVRDIVTAGGHSAPDVSGLTGIVTGYRIDRPMSVRAALEPLAFVYDFTIVEDAGALRFIHNGRSEATALTLDDLAEKHPGPAEFIAADPKARMRELRLHYIDSGGDYRAATVSAQDDLAQSEGVIDMTAPLVMDAAGAKAVTVQIMSAATAARRSAQFLLMPRAHALQPGDIVTLRDSAARYQIEALDGLMQRDVTARALPDGRGLALVTIGEPAVPDTPLWTSEPQIIVIDAVNLPLFEGRSGPLIVANAEPFSPVTVIHAGAQITLNRRAMVGTTLTDFLARPVGRFDEAGYLDIELAWGHIASVEELDVLSGGNALALETLQGWEIIQFQYAQLIAPRTYRLSRFLRGQAGSDYAMAANLAAGARLVILNDAAQPLALSNELAGTTVTLQVYTGDRAMQKIEVDYTAAHLKPLSPVYLRATETPGSLNISWLRRGRSGADSWAGTDIPLGEETEQYSVTVIKNDVRLAQYLMPQHAFSMPMQNLPDRPFQIAVAQLSMVIGAGFATKISLT
ncbi:baseplate multidomain protein megatron [Robiginitomaculum antarcticum]|uniref:baseplate multidomain protein megatron n=1 Tax=Robiginitomaculum antarcticum TaxID=437507 RepID=UPI0003604533|nr:glycoside hydrolase/phage tail family protein [Robiginitomaculum antarcticum]